MTFILPMPNRHSRLIRCGLVSLAICTAITVLSVAAPSLPKPHIVAEEILSTAQIQAVQLDVGPLPNELTKVGITTETIRTLGEEMLDAEGYIVDRSKASPRLVVTILAATTPEIKEGISLIAMIDVYQNVSVHRIDMDLTVPTMTIVIPELVPAYKLKTRTDQLCRNAFNLLLNTFGMANDAMKSRKAIDL